MSRIERDTWSFATVVEQAQERATDGPVLATFDAPFGVPVSYLTAAAREWELHAGSTFLDMLQVAATREHFFDAVATDTEWSISRPFFAAPAGEQGLNRYKHAADDPATSDVGAVDISATVLEPIHSRAVSSIRSARGGVSACQRYEGLVAESARDIRVRQPAVGGGTGTPFPADAWNDPSRWDISGLEPFLQRFDINFHPDYLVDVPRPTLALWFGDAWRVSDELSINYGVRWDADWGAMNPPRVIDRVILFDNGFESGDFGYKTGIRDLASVAPRVFYDPATGYNKDPRTFGRPNRDYDQINWFESTGTQDYLGLATGFTRRFQKGLQAGATYTLLFYKRDDGDIGYVAGASDNPFDAVRGEWACSTDFQRNTVRLHATVQLPYDISTSAIYFYGSGSYYQTTVATVPYGKPGTNRLNIGNPIIVPDVVRDRVEGPAVIGRNEVVPRNALRGFPLHKVDLRVSKRVAIGNVRVTGLAEVFNLFNRKNYGNYVGQVDSARFGQPAASSGNAYVPRSGQLGFRIDF